MTFDYEYVKPVSGGGLGDCKVGIVELSGDYETGGIDIGIKEEPIFITASGGYQAVFASGKVKLMSAGGSSGGQVVIPEQTVTGVAFTNEQAITGTVADTTATIQIGDADVSGSVVIPTQTVEVTGSSQVAGGEVPQDTDVTGVKILFIIKGSY